MADEERKLFIDEDWKAQVQREKEEARRKLEEQAKQGDQPAADQPADAEVPEPAAGAAAPDAEEAEPTLFLALVQSLAAQSMYALGLIAEQGAQQVMVDLRQAKYIIDTLMMLREKTEGHLEPEEKRTLSEVLGELQQFYVLRAQQVQEQALRQAGINPGDLGKK